MTPGVILTPREYARLGAYLEDHPDDVALTLSDHHFRLNEQEATHVAYEAFKERHMLNAAKDRDPYQRAIDVEWDLNASTFAEDPIEALQLPLVTEAAIAELRGEEGRR